MNISIIVAIARNHGIGFENKLLYWLPNDLKRFLHEFSKVEIVRIDKPEHSEQSPIHYFPLDRGGISENSENYYPKIETLSLPKPGKLR